MKKLLILVLAVALCSSFAYANCGKEGCTHGAKVEEKAPAADAPKADVKADEKAPAAVAPKADEKAPAVAPKADAPKADEKAPEAAAPKADEKK